MNNQLLYEVIEYNKKRKYAFNHNVQFKQNIEYERILKARYNKVGRIKKRFIYLICRYKYLYFCTFTFDDYFINLCDRSRKDLIKKSLYNFDKDIKYILNIDYGKTTERLHYHCIVATNENVDLNSFLQNDYPCFTYSEEIRISSDDIKRTSKYLNKLTNHAIKESTKRSRILYNFKGYDTFDKNYAHVLYFYDTQRVGLT